MELQIHKSKNVITPTRGTTKSAGIDFYIPNDFTPTILQPQADILIPSGIYAKLPKGYALVANNKSGVATKRKLIHGASVVDEDYQGEIHIHLINAGKNPQILNPGEKIIQFLLEKQNYATVKLVDSLDKLYTNNTERGNKGFGSTDNK